ncbi:MAG: DUF4956 domain-containing protein [Spirochaetaceae bacterium]|jgi:uncharacterized membrane protein YhiD involved in acid resistance|nr:DUF4956 domain-containing protein [Spirochaetaceae bacterium]
MPEFFFNLHPLEMTGTVIVMCTLTSLFAGVVTAVVYTFRHVSNKNFVITLALLPVIVQSIIMLVNGQVGTGIAVMGAFSLVRFRSVPGTAKEITSIFLAMALGLATGTGYIWYAVIFTIVINSMILFFSIVRFGEAGIQTRNLKIIIPENKDYTSIFNDLFAEYTKNVSLERVRTVNLGSLYELQYSIVLKDPQKEKEFIDKIRSRNSNLEISCGRGIVSREEL